MSYVAIVGAVVSAGTAAYGAYSKKKSEKKAAQAQVGNVGQTPEAAEYKPVDFSEEQLNAITSNLNSLPHGGRDLMTTANESLDRDALNRARKFIPNYAENMRLEGENAHSLLSGQLPYDDALDVVANRSGLSNALGTPGGGAPQTFRDLGISRLNAMSTGAGLLQNMVGIAEQVNPVSRRTKASDFFVSPIDRIKLTMEQNQLIQQSDQNKNNLEAGVSPTQTANQQLALNRALNGGSGGVDVSALGGSASQMVAALSKLYGGAGTPATFDTTGAGAAGEYGSTYAGTFSDTGLPAYRPQTYSIPA